MVLFFASFLEMSRLSHINCLILVCMYKFYEGFDNLIFLSMNNDAEIQLFYVSSLTIDFILNTILTIYLLQIEIAEPSNYINLRVHSKS